MTSIISVFNQAGGVAKTTLTMNLGYELAVRGQRVLLIDLDPQGSLTIFQGINPWELEQCIYDVLLKGVAPEAILCSANRMDLLPANRTLGMAELELGLAPMRERKLSQALAPIVNQYDFILIDCPPSLGMLSYLALATSSSVLIPVECEFKAYHGTDLLLDTIAKVKQSGANPDLQVMGFVPTKYTSTKAQHQRVLEAIRSQLSPLAPVFDPIVNTIAFVDASENRQPLALYSSRHKALAALRSLASAIIASSTPSTLPEVSHA